MFKFENVDYENFKQEYLNRRKFHKKRKKTEKIVNGFIESGFKCAKVIQEGDCFYNNNDCRTAIASYLREHRMNIKVYMLYGEVYMVREE